MRAWAGALLAVLLLAAAPVAAPSVASGPVADAHAAHRAGQAPVRQRATLAISTKVVVGTPIRAVGTFRPISKGRPVQLQVFRTVAGRSSWRTVSIRREDSRGRVTFRLPTSRPGLFKYRLLAPAHRRLRAIATTARWVRVAPLPGSGTLERLRIGGVIPNRSVHGAEISADGRYVAFLTGATNLSVGETDVDDDVFWADLVAGTVRKVSRPYAPGGHHGQSFQLSLSDDGQRVAYTTSAADIAPADINGRPDVYLYEVGADRNVRLSNSLVTRSSANGASAHATISGDGSTVVFSSDATDLVTGSPPPVENVYVADLGAASVSLLTTTTAGGASTGGSRSPSVSKNGRFVAFTSTARDLVPDMTGPGRREIFWFDRASGQRNWVTRAGSAMGTPTSPVISPDGLRVAFVAYGDAPPDEASDVFTWRVGSDHLQRVTRSSGGVVGNRSSWSPEFTSDSKQLRFQTEATNLVAVPAGSPPVLGADLATGRLWLATRRLRGPAAGADPVLFDVTRTSGPTLLGVKENLGGVDGSRLHLFLFHPCSTEHSC